jgi:glycosyltransferase involved in cell wall biosynthesis
MKMEQKPLISIGIPTYNRPIGLKKALTSVIRQTYPHLEIIISDNASTDAEVAKIAKEFENDDRITFIQQPVNSGIVSNFNTVLEKATGDYFMWLADDDWIDSNYIEICLNFLFKNPDYGAAYGLANIYSTEGKWISCDDKIDLTQILGKERMKHLLKNMGNNGYLSALFRGDFKKELLMKDIIAIDWLVVMRIAFLKKFKLLQTTNKHISRGGLSSSIESLTKDMSLFTRSFPYLAVALNVASDVLWGSSAYKSLSPLERLQLARQCFVIITIKFNVKSQVKPGLKKYLLYKWPKLLQLLAKFKASFLFSLICIIIGSNNNYPVHSCFVQGS